MYPRLHPVRQFTHLCKEGAEANSVLHHDGRIGEVFLVLHGAQRHAGFVGQHHGVIGLDRVGIDCLFDLAGIDLHEFRRQAHHAALGHDGEARIELRIFQRYRHDAAARDRAVGD